MRASFQDYQDKILTVAGYATLLLTAEPPEDTSELDHCRARMARIFTSYHLYAEREIFGPRARIAGLGQRLSVNGLSADCASIAADFRAFARQCAETPVVARWPSYRVSALAIIDRIRNHLRLTELEILRSEDVQRSVSRTHVA